MVRTKERPLFTHDFCSPQNVAQLVQRHTKDGFLTPEAVPERRDPGCGCFLRQLRRPLLAVTEWRTKLCAHPLGAVEWNQVGS